MYSFTNIIINNKIIIEIIFFWFFYKLLKTRFINLVVLLEIIYNMTYFYYKNESNCRWVMFEFGGKISND